MSSRRNRVRLIASASLAVAGLVASMASGAAAVAGQPVLVSPPTISGVAKVGQTLTATDSVWLADGFRIGASERVWDRCSGNLVSECTAIQDGGVYEDGKSYVPTNADLGSVIRVWNALNVPGWKVTAISGPTAVVTVAARPRISAVTVKGPSKVVEGHAATYEVKISNSGGAKATGVRLKVSGRGVAFSTSVGSVAAGKSRTVRVRLRPTKPGKIKAAFKVTSGNAGGKVAKKTIIVRSRSITDQ